MHKTLCPKFMFLLHLHLLLQNPCSYCTYIFLVILDIVNKKLWLSGSCNHATAFILASLANIRPSFCRRNKLLSSHSQSDKDNSPDNFEKHPQDVRLKGIFTLMWTYGLQVMRTHVWQLWKSSIYHISLFLSTTSKCFTILLQNPAGHF